MVAAGESVGLIAQKYKLSVKELMSLNGLENSNIKIGQKLKVINSAPARAPEAKPAPAAAPKTHTVTEGQSLGLIAQKYNLSVKDLQALNNLSDSRIKTGQKLVVSGRPKGAAASAPASSTGGTYQVVSGDTLLGIARKTKVPVDQLKKLNKMENNDLRAGQLLKLK